jgi:hypothetical protein
MTNARLFLLVLLFTPPAACRAADDLVSERRAAGWQQKLESLPFRFDEKYAGITAYIGEFSGDGQLIIVKDPKPRSGLKIKVICDGKERVSVGAHLGSAFLTHEGLFYYARFGSLGPGCVVEAFDLSDGRQTWEASELRKFGPFGSSGYRNQVQMRFSRENEVPEEPKAGSIVVTGRESYGDYRAVIDRKTGEMLARRVYRKNFDPIEQSD